MDHASYRIGFVELFCERQVGDLFVWTLDGPAFGHSGHVEADGSADIAMIELLDLLIEANRWLVEYMTGTNPDTPCCLPIPIATWANRYQPQILILRKQLIARHSRSWLDRLLRRG